jgi:hypothetical protein
MAALLAAIKAVSRVHERGRTGSPPSVLRLPRRGDAHPEPIAAVHKDLPSPNEKAEEYEHHYDDDDDPKDSADRKEHSKRRKHFRPQGRCGSVSSPLLDL